MKKKALLDSNIVIDYDRDTYRPDPIGAIDWLEEMISNRWRFFISEITVMETFKLYVRQTRPRELDEFKERFKLFQKERKVKILQLSKKIRKRARELMEILCSQQIPPKGEDIIYDMFIAATALEHSLTLFTQNIRHFNFVPGLQVEKPDYGDQEA